jgi:hypothetical protein
MFVHSGAPKSNLLDDDDDDDGDANFGNDNDDDDGDNNNNNNAREASTSRRRRDDGAASAGDDDNLFRLKSIDGEGYFKSTFYMCSHRLRALVRVCSINALDSGRFRAEFADDAANYDAQMQDVSA